jgi:hypothetical protein
MFCDGAESTEITNLISTSQTSHRIVVFAEQIVGSGPLVGKPAIAKFWDHIRLDGDKAVGFKSLQILPVRNAV